MAASWQHTYFFYRKRISLELVKEGPIHHGRTLSLGEHCLEALWMSAGMRKVD